MDSRISLEILGQGFCADVLNQKILQRGAVQFELALIGRKDEASPRRQDGHRQTNHPDVIPLDIQGPGHPLGGRKGGGVQENQVNMVCVLV